MIYRFSDLQLDLDRRELRRDGAAVHLTNLNYRVLEALVKAAPGLLSHDELIEQAWGENRIVTPENLTQRIKVLRDSLGDDASQPRYIEAVHGQGVRLLPKVSALTPETATALAPAAVHRGSLIWGILTLVVAVLAAIQFWPVADPVTVVPVAEDPSQPNSIAVLPFVNRSEHQKDGYFADGMHDELLTRLANISALRVISRTTVMGYRNSEKSLPEIARELSVATILEGGVQRAGNQVRINVQLIDAETDGHLWAKTFDRELTTENLFGIQSEISKAIAAALRAELSPQTLAIIEEVATQNAEAYELYLRAITERNRSPRSATFKVMKPLLERAVALDPNFLRAQVLLAETYGRLVWSGADPDRIYGAKSLELVTDIRRRWPDRVEGHLALGHYFYAVERDYTRALAEYQMFEAAFPNDLEVLRALAASLKRSGRFEEQLRYARRLAALDPENPLAARDLLYALRFNGLVAETLATAEQGASRFPGDRGWVDDLATYRLFFLGDVEGYLAHGEQLRKQDRWAAAGEDLTWLLYGQGDVELALEHAATRMRTEYGWNEMTVDLDRVIILRLEGRNDEAQATAGHALGFVKAWIEGERPFPDSRDRYWYTWAAYCAAIAGDLDAVANYQTRAALAAADGHMVERFSVLRDARIEALVGDAAAGWETIETLGHMVMTAEYVAVHPYYQYLFADVPAYQNFIADLKS